MHELIDNRGALVLKILIDFFFLLGLGFFILFYIFSNKKKNKVTHEKEERKKRSTMRIKGKPHKNMNPNKP